MKQFQNVYDLNKKLDEEFNKDYNIYSLEIINKNILELLVELGEFANETRVFKYWSNKAPSDKEVILEEFADCMIMSLCFLSIFDVELDEEFPVQSEEDVITEFTALYGKVATLNGNFNKETSKDVFSSLVHLGNSLGYCDEEINDACLKKIEKNFGRFETGAYGKKQ